MIWEVRTLIGYLNSAVFVVGARSALGISGSCLQVLMGYYSAGMFANLNLLKQWAHLK